MSNSPNFSFSVLLPLFYKEMPQYLDNCLQSIYYQSLLPDEIVLVKEGVLTDEHFQILNKWNIFNEKISQKIIDADILQVKGLPACLNLGIEHCSSEYIARFDTDDENILNRFELQVKFLKKNKNIVLLGGQIEEYDQDLIKVISKREVPIEDNKIKKFATWRNPFNHQTVFYKKDIALALGGYPLVKSNEDYAFWGKFMANGYEVGNLPDILVKARTGTDLFKRRRGKKYLKGEIESLNSLYETGFFNKVQYITHVVLRTFIRLLPQSLVAEVYGILRKRNL